MYFWFPYAVPMNSENRTVPGGGNNTEINVAYRNTFPGGCIEPNVWTDETYKMQWKIKAYHVVNSPFRLDLSRIKSVERLCTVLHTEDCSTCFRKAEQRWLDHHCWLFHSWRIIRNFGCSKQICTAGKSVEERRLVLVSRLHETVNRVGTQSG